MIVIANRFKNRLSKIFIGLLYPNFIKLGINLYYRSKKDFLYSININIAYKNRTDIEKTTNVFDTK